MLPGTIASYQRPQSNCILSPQRCISRPHRTSACTEKGVTIPQLTQNKCYSLSRRRRSHHTSTSAATKASDDPEWGHRLIGGHHIWDFLCYYFCTTPIPNVWSVAFFIISKCPNISKPGKRTVYTKRRNKYSEFCILLFTVVMLTRSTLASKSI